MKFRQGANDLFELRPFPAKRLRALGLVPDVGLLELSLYLYETF